MHTLSCAKLSFDENERGSLTENKFADFVVLDQNPLSIPIEKIKDIQIKAVYLNGERYTGLNEHPMALALNSSKGSVKNNLAFSGADPSRLLALLVG